MQHAIDAVARQSRFAVRLYRIATDDRVARSRLEEAFDHSLAPVATCARTADRLQHHAHGLIAVKRVWAPLLTKDVLVVLQHTLSRCRVQVAREHRRGEVGLPPGRSDLR